MQTNKKGLFDSDHSEVEEIDTELLDNKNKLFSGKNGRLLFEIQKSYKGDKRFQLDGRFKDIDLEKVSEGVLLNYDKDEEVSIDMEEATEPSTDALSLEKEKYNYYMILEKVLDIELRRPKKKKANNMPMQRFDPSKAKSQDLLVKNKPVEPVQLEPTKKVEKIKKKKENKKQTVKGIKKPKLVDINYNALKNAASTVETVKEFRLFGN